MKKFLILLLAILLVLSPIVQAAEYSDVKSSHWAYPFIQSMTNLQYLKGYPDGSFKPEVNIKFTELMTTISKFHGRFAGKNPEDGSALNNVITKYGAQTIQPLQSSLPDWSHNYVFYALDNGIVTLSELTTLKANNKFESKVNREDTMAYFAKAMMLESKAQQKVVVALPYKDAQKINPIKQKYISVLLDLNILAPEGKVKKGVSGNFYPEDSITRAEMSKILSLGNGAMGNPQSATPTPEQPKDQFVPAQAVGNILKASSTSITIKTDKGAEKTFKLDNNTQLTLSGAKASASDMKEGQKAEVYYNLVNDTAKTVKLSNLKKEFKGYVSKIENGIITVQMDNTSQAYKLDVKSKVTFNGKIDNQAKIEVNDYVKGVAVEDMIESIDVEKLQEYNGTIKDVDQYRSTAYIEYTVGNTTTTRTFTITDKVQIIIDQKTARLADLRVGTPVVLGVKNDDLIRITTQKDQDFKGVVKSVEGGSTVWHDGKVDIVITVDKKDYNLYADQRTIIRNAGGNFQNLDRVYVNALTTEQLYWRPSGTNEVLKQGDNIEAKVSYNYIAEFTAWRSSETVNGTIQSITTAWNNYPTINVDVNGKIRTFQINPQSKINGQLITNIDNQLYNGMQVRISLSNDVVNEISTFGAASQTIRGTIDSVDINRELIQIKDGNILKGVRLSRNSNVNIKDYFGKSYTTQDAYNWMKVGGRIEVYGTVGANNIIDPIVITFESR